MLLLPQLPLSASPFTWLILTHLGQRMPRWHLPSQPFLPPCPYPAPGGHGPVCASAVASAYPAYQCISSAGLSSLTLRFMVCSLYMVDSYSCLLSVLLSRSPLHHMHEHLIVHSLGVFPVLFLRVFSLSAP